MSDGCEYCRALVERIKQALPNCDWNCDEACHRWCEESEQIPRPVDGVLQFEPEALPDCPECGRQMEITKYSDGQLSGRCCCGDCVLGETMTGLRQHWRARCARLRDAKARNAVEPEEAIEDAAEVERLLKQGWKMTPFRPEEEWPRCPVCGTYGHCWRDSRQDLWLASCDCGMAATMASDMKILSGRWRAVCARLLPAGESLEGAAPQCLPGPVDLPPCPECGGPMKYYRDMSRGVWVADCDCHAATVESADMDALLGQWRTRCRRLRSAQDADRAGYPPKAAAPERVDLTADAPIKPQNTGAPVGVERLVAGLQVNLAGKIFFAATTSFSPADLLAGRHAEWLEAQREALLARWEEIRAEFVGRADEWGRTHCEPCPGTPG